MSFKLPIKRVVAGAVLAAVVLALLWGTATRRSAGVAAQDQAAPPVTSTPPATMSVSGHGAVTLVPDTASVVLGVKVNRETLIEAQAEATARMAAIIAAVEAAGVEERDIRTSNYSVNIIHNNSLNPAPIIGYEVRNEVAVKVRQLNSLGMMLDAAVAEGANQVNGISFMVNDPSAAVSQARQLAVQDARRKADELAAAAGVEVARVTSITETYSPPAPAESATFVFTSVDSGPADPRPPVPVQTGSTEVSVDVQMSFELREKAS